MWMERSWPGMGSAATALRWLIAASLPMLLLGVDDDDCGLIGVDGELGMILSMATCSSKREQVSPDVRLDL